MLGGYLYVFRNFNLRGKKLKSLLINFLEDEFAREFFGKNTNKKITATKIFRKVGKTDRGKNS